MPNDKKRLFLNSLLIGTVLILSVVVSVFATTGLAIVAAYFGISIFYDSWMILLVNALVTFLMYFVCFLMLRPLEKKKIYEIASLNSATDSTLQGVLFILGCSMVGNFITAILNEFLTRTTGFEAVQPEVLEEAASTPVELIFKLLTIALLPALLEEFAFRGMLLGVLRKFGNWSAIIISALLFAISHGNFIQIPFAFIFGIAAGLVVVITDSLWPVIIAHFINNALSVVSTYALSESVLTFISYLVIFFVFAALLSLVYFAVTGRFKRLKSNNSISFCSSLLYAFISPTVLIYTLYFLYSAVMSRA